MAVTGGSRTTLDMGAAASFSEPLFKVLGDEYTHERLAPLWNPYQSYGTPLAANMQSEAYYPLAIALALHLTPTTYSWFILLRLLIAGICAYLYLRMFVCFEGALAGGIANMLAGYYVLYLTAPHLSVEVLIPAGLLASEYLIRRPEYKSVIFFALAFLLLVVGGMPESTALAVSFLYLYLTFRLATDSHARAGWPHTTKMLGIATALGLLLSAFLLIPFVEFLHISFDIHQPQNIGGRFMGLIHDRPDPSIFTYICPTLFAPYGTPTPFEPYKGVRNYFGITSLFLVFVAASALLAPREQLKSRRNSIAFFFLFSVIFLLLKRYGFPLINSIGMLPLYRFVWFPKYQEPLLSASISALVGVGVHNLSKGLVSVRKQVFSAALAVLTLAAAALFCRNNMGALMGLPACLLACLIALLALFPGAQSAAPATNRIIGLSMLTMLTGEMSLSFLVPPFYFGPNRLPTASANPYIAPPFVKFLKEHDSDKHYRIFGNSRVFSADWASAYQLHEIRGLDALYYAKYLPFVRNFLADSDYYLYDRFTGGGSYEFDDYLGRRLLQLSSVGWVVAPKRSNLKEGNTRFKLVYSGDAKVYAYREVLPRATIYYHADLESGDNEVLQKLATPSTDVFQTVVLNSSKLTRQQALTVARINRRPAMRVQAATIRSYASQVVDIETTLNRDGILVLNDSDYPGWMVEVDGHPGEWFSANYLFRGVALTRGKHRVRFSYKPRSFFVGALISVTTLIAVIVLGLVSRRYKGLLRVKPLKVPLALNERQTEM